MKKNDIYIRKYWLYLIPYFFLVFLFFISIAYPVLNNEMDFQFYSDSKTYEDEAKYYSRDLVAVSGNFFGPILILRLLGPNNYIGVFFVNIIIFFLSLYFFTRDYKLKLKIFLPLLLLNPITFSSIMSINKEIISLLFLSILVYNHNRKKIIFIILLIIISWFVRWQLTLFYITYLFACSKLLFIKNRLTVVILLLVCISVILYLFGYILDDVFSRYELFKDNYDGIGTFNTIMNIQYQYGYIFAFPLKALHLMLGMLIRYKTIFDFSDVYNNFILYIQCIFNAIVLFKVFYRKLYYFKYDWFYISIIYCAVFSITPIYNSRYLYPAFILLSYLLAYETSYNSSNTNKYSKLSYID